MNPSPSRLAVIGAYAAVYIIWGSTYLAIRESVMGMPAMAVVGLRFFIGGIILMLLAWAQGRLKTRPTSREILGSGLLGLLLLVGGNGMVTVAEKEVPSYLAALIITATTPLGVAFFDRIFFSRKSGLLRLLGALLGVVGSILLLWNGKSLAGSLNPWVLLVAAASLSFAFGTSLGPKSGAHKDAVVNSALQMLIAGGGVTLILWATGTGPGEWFAHADARALFSFVYLALAGTFGFVAYTFLVSVEPPLRVVTYALVNPVIAILLGVLVGEKLTPLFAVGVPIILVAVAMMFYGDEVWRRISARRD